MWVDEWTPSAPSEWGEVSSFPQKQLRLRNIAQPQLLGSPILAIPASAVLALLLPPHPQFLSLELDPLIPTAVAVPAGSYQTAVLWIDPPGQGQVMGVLWYASGPPFLSVVLL